MKRIIVLLLSALLVVSLCSCYSGTESKEQIEALKNGDNTNTDEKDIDSKAKIGALKNGDSTNTDEKDIDSKAKTVTLNTPFNVGKIMTITLNSSEWCEEILPSNTSDGYSYSKNKEGEKYFVIHGELKNLATQTLDVTYAGKAEILINGKYKLSAEMKLEENDGTSFYGSAKPLQTLPLIIYTSVSDELYENCKDIQLSLDLVTDDEKVGYFYQDDYPHDSFQISFEK